MADGKPALEGRLGVPQKQVGESARQYAYRVLLWNITRLKLPPGMVLEEAQICALLGVSRTPVREALLELQRQRLVEIRPQHGTFVARIDPGHIDQVRFYRMVLETAAAELACALPPGNPDIAAMEENLALQELQRQKGDFGRLLELDRDFHRLLFQAVNLPFAYEQLRDVTPHFDRERALSFEGEKPAVIVADHRRLLDAILYGDPACAREAMAQHLERVRADQAKLQARYPEYYV